MNPIKWILNEVKSFFSWFSFWPESEGKRLEWYRKEIIDAFEERDFERASFLETEMKRI